MNRHPLPAAALLAAALLLLTACSSDDDGSSAADPSSSPSSSDTTPATQLIDYEKDDAGGVTLRKPADVAGLTGAPDDFRQYMAGFVNATVTGIQEDPECPVVVQVSQLDTSGYAAGFTGACGGAAYMWAKRDGIWQQIWVGQEIPKCSDMTKYSVPKAIAGDRCQDGKKDIAYSG